MIRNAARRRFFWSSGVTSVMVRGLALALGCLFGPRVDLDSILGSFQSSLPGVKKNLLSILLFGVMCSACGGGYFPFPAVVIPPGPIASDYPDSGAVVLNDVRSIDFRLSKARGRTRLIAVETHHRRMKILTRDGLRETQISLPIDGFSSVTNISARSVNPGGRIQDMPRSFVRHSTGTKSNPELTELGHVHFSVPGAQTGGIVEYYYERVYTEPDMIPVWVLGDRLPVLRSELSLTSEPFVQLQYRFGHGGRLVDATPMVRQMPDGRTRTIFVESNLPQIRSELGSPHPAWLSPWVAVVASAAQIEGRKYRMETWAHVGERVGFLASRVPKGTIANSGDAEARFKAIRDKLTPIAKPGLGVLGPISKQELEGGKPVCSRDAAALLMESLREAGEDAYLALLTGNFGPPVLEGFPGLYPFTRAVVAVDVHKRLSKEESCSGAPAQRNVLCSTADHGYTFVDPLCKSCRFGELPTEFSGGRALVLSSTTPEWVDVPMDPPERNFTVIEVNLEAELDGAVRGVARVAAGGEPGRRLKQALRADKLEGEGGQHLAKAFGEVFGPSDSISWEADNWSHGQGDDILKGKAKVALGLKKLAYGRFEVRARDVAGGAFPWGWRELRRFPRILQAPLWRQTSSLLKLPVGFEVGLPVPEKMITPFGEFSATWKVEEEGVRYWRSFILRQQVILPEQWGDFTEFLNQIRAFEEKPISIIRSAE